ncbi:GntR family transcriptional regulator [Planobispora rosea]|uniref:GntR family transcriptional regulator n=1 Tax=Planobispora rosea TaxID=35762 RepID=UPI00083A262C|nr:GntR family transcriptional regulator [Planobispora rosea]
MRVTAEEIAGYYRQAIWGGQYVAGDVLPRAVDVATQLDADRKTVLDAYKSLAEEGLVEVKRRLGTVVTYQTPMRRLGAERYARSRRARGIVAFAADREASGQSWQRTDQTPTVRRVPASPEVAEAFQLPAGTEVIERARLVRDAEGRPTQSLTSWYRVNDVAGTEIETSTVGTAGSGGGYSVLDELGIGPTEVTEELWNRMPLPNEAALLELPGSVPITELTRWARHNDYLVEYARGLYVGPRFRWSYTIPIPD